MKTMITASNIVKSYQKKEVIHNLSFTIEENEVVALIGPNGAGKSTLIELLLGILTPDTGKIILHQDFKKKIGAQLQDTPFFPELTVEENLQIFSSFYKMKQTKAQRMAFLESFQLQAHAKKLTAKLSGGQQKKLAIAMATVHQPRLIVLDEPSAALDPKAKSEMLAFLQQIKNKGATLLFSSHDMQEVEALADRVLFIMDGTIQLDGAIPSLLHHYQVPTLEALYLLIANREVQKQ